MNSPHANFNRCKLCQATTAVPTYHLAKTTIYRCSSCDFHFSDYLDEALPPAAPTILDSNTGRYIDMRSHSSRDLTAQRLALITRYRDIQDCNLLDIGAGTGQFILAAKQQGAHAVGIEPSQLRRDYALANSALSLHPETVESPFWQAAYREYFHIITLWDVIEHVNFPVETLSRAVSLLKPGGLLLLETPDRQALPYRLSERFYRLSNGRISLFLNNFYSVAPYGHKQIFTRPQLIELCEQSGLQLYFQSGDYQCQTAHGKNIILAAVKPG